MALGLFFNQITYVVNHVGACPITLAVLPRFEILLVDHTVARAHEAADHQRFASPFFAENLFFFAQPQAILGIVGMKSALVVRDHDQFLDSGPEIRFHLSHGVALENGHARLQVKQLADDLGAINLHILSLVPIHVNILGVCSEGVPPPLHVFAAG